MKPESVKSTTKTKSETKKNEPVKVVPNNVYQEFTVNIRYKKPSQ